jgi:hypothetical protein
MLRCEEEENASGKGRLTREEFDGMIDETIEILFVQELISSHQILTRADS